MEFYESGRDATFYFRKDTTLFSASSVNFTTLISIFAATDDPIGGLDHALPIHPDEGSSKPFEYWEEQLHKRKPRKQTPQSPAEKPHDPSHQIDDFA